MYGIRRDTYHQAYIPAVHYLTAHATSEDLIFATGEFGFGLGFYGNVIDDSTLGYSTGKRAAYVGSKTPVTDSPSKGLRPGIWTWGTRCATPS